MNDNSYRVIIPQQTASSITLCQVNHQSISFIFFNVWPSLYWAWGCGSVVDHLPRIHQALGPTPSTAKKKSIVVGEGGKWSLIQMSAAAFRPGTPCLSRWNLGLCLLLTVSCGSDTSEFAANWTSFVWGKVKSVLTDLIHTMCNGVNRV